MSKFINEAGWDRIARVVLGLALLAVGFSGLVAAPWGLVIGVVGLIPLFIGLVGYCPLYGLFGLRTKRG
jgi:Protein of unknown function (DUF2892)